MMTMNQTGLLQAYEAAGKTFDQYLIEQAVPKADQEEAKDTWTEIVQFRKDNPDATMMVPSD